MKNPEEEQLINATRTLADYFRKYCPHSSENADNVSKLAAELLKNNGGMANNPAKLVEDQAADCTFKADLVALLKIGDDNSKRDNKTVYSYFIGDDWIGENKYGRVVSQETFANR